MPVPAAVAPPPPPPPPPPVAREAIAVELRPRVVHISGTEAVLEFELELTNTQAVSAEGIRISLGLISANPAQDAWVGTFHAAPTVQPAADPFTLRPGQAWRTGGRLQLPMAQLHVVKVGGRPMFVPLLMIDLKWRGGLSLKRQGADFMIGTAGQGGKLGPIWLDRRQHSGLAANRYVAPPVKDAVEKRSA